MVIGKMIWTVTRYEANKVRRDRKNREGKVTMERKGMKNQKEKEKEKENEKKDAE